LEPWFSKRNWATNDVKEKDGGNEVEVGLLLFAILF
jgi:hypothetical protein